MADRQKVRFSGLPPGFDSFLLADSTYTRFILSDLPPELSATAKQFTNKRKHVAVSGNPQPKVVLKLSTSTLGFCKEIYQYTRDIISVNNLYRKTNI